MRQAAIALTRTAIAASRTSGMGVRVIARIVTKNARTTRAREALVEVMRRLRSKSVVPVRIPTTPAEDAT